LRVSVLKNIRQHFCPCWLCVPGVILRQGTVIMSDKIRVRKYPVKGETNHLLKPRAIMALVKTELYLRVLGKRFKEDLCVSTECFLGFCFFLKLGLFSDLGPKWGIRFPLSLILK